MNPKTQARQSALLSAIRLSLLVVLPNFSSCSSLTKWSLMPTPIVHQYVGEKSFSDISDEEKSPNIEIFYATNRPGSGSSDDRTYTNGLVDQLQLGKATVHFGDENMTWAGLLTLSTLRKGKNEIPLKLEQAQQIAILSGKQKSFSESINQSISLSKGKQLTIYVHGAQSSFFKACVQGAQFRHFMARESVLLSYAWPSTGKFFGYKKDVRFAAQSVDQFADLIEFLAANTNAEKINILAYSAGAQIVAPSLALLRERHAADSELTLKRKFRLGIAYFAAPDVSLTKFTNTYLPAFHKIVDNTTVSFHRKDSVLGLAITANKESRLGRPDPGELSEQEVSFLEKTAQKGQLDVIDMQHSPDKRPLNFKSHGHWYSNEWVSSDVLIQFLYQLRPEQRGLKQKPDSPMWYFPLDYPDTLKKLIEREKPPL